MYRRIELNPERIMSDADMKEYISNLSLLYDAEAVNLDALLDLLTEVTDQVDIIVTPETICRICDNGYAYKVLLAFSLASKENPNIHLYFRRG